MYADATDQAKEVVLGAQFEVMLWSLLFIFLLRTLYSLHNAEFWTSTRVRFMLLLLTVPIVLLIGKSSQLFQHSEDYACLNVPSDEDMKYQN